MPRVALAWLMAVIGGGCDRAGGEAAPKPTTSAGLAARVAAPDPAHDPQFGIGGGETDPHTHAGFDTPQHLVSASVRVVVDKTATVGLNFFALQVDFDNSTWAHGGLQDVDADGKRARQVNWGGLVDRGGGTADYDKENDAVDLDKIQNPPDGKNVGAYTWTNGGVYDLVVERGERVTLPVGDYRLLPSKPSVHIDHARAMWEWRFTIRPVGTAAPGTSFVAVLYDAATTFTGFSVWNESGYGSKDDALHARWSDVRYTTVDDKTPRPPAAWSRD